MVHRLRAREAVALAAFVPLAIFVASARIHMANWDTGDLQVVAWIAGIPYPTGFPGYVLFGWLWTHAIPFASVAWRLNVLSGVAMATAAGTIAAVALALGTAVEIAVLAGWLFAFGHEVWWHAAYADAHPLGFALALAALACGCRWSEAGDRRGLIAAVLLAAIALAVDNTTVLLLAGLPILIFARTRHWGALLPACAAGIVIIAAAYAFLPLRSAYNISHAKDPTLALGIAPGRPYFDDHDPRTFAGFHALVAGSEWQPEYALKRTLSLHSLQKTWDEFAPDFHDDLPFGLAFVALAGLLLLARQRPLPTIALVLGALLAAIFGASYIAEADPERYVFLAFAAAALGLAVAAEWLRARVAAWRPSAALAVPLVLLAALGAQGVQSGDVWAKRGDLSAQRLAERAAALTRDGAVIITPWDQASPLAYHAYVDRAMGRRIVLCVFYQNVENRIDGWLTTREVDLVSVGTPVLPGHALRRLDAGTPGIYQVLP